MTARIAVADDDPVVCTTFARLLEAFGHSVVCIATNGAELIEGCANTQVDLAFVDFHMPIMDGLEAAEHLTAMGIPVVLVSGHPDALDIVIAHEPIVSILLKPATVDSLRTVIQKTLAQVPRPTLMSLDGMISRVGLEGSSS